jgi:hypothetical protein
MTNENLVFILDIGNGAFGNFPPPEIREPITVLGTNGQFAASGETHTSGVFWQEHSWSYEIKAYSERLTKDEMMQIAKSLVLLKPTGGTPSP